MVCLGRQRHVQRNDFGFARERFCIGVFDARFGGPIRDWKWIISQHSHPETAQYVSDDASDLSGADDASGFAMKIETDQPIERKIQVVHTVVRARDFSIECEEQPNRVLRNRIGRIRRNTRDGKPELLAA